MENPSVVIIIPMYQAKSTIKRSILSAIRQKKIKKKIYLIDHGSTDGSLTVVDRYLKKGSVEYIRIKRHKNEKKSASRPLNIGILKAIKENNDGIMPWIMRLDSDDVLSSDSIICEQLQKCNYADICISPVIFFNKESKKAKLFSIKECYLNYSSLMNGAVYSMGHHASLFSLEKIKQMYKDKKHLFDENICYGEDLDFSYRVLGQIEANKVAFTDKASVFKSLGDTTITSTTSKNSFIDDHKIIFSKNKKLSKYLLLRAILHTKLDCSPAIQNIIGCPGKVFGYEKVISYSIVENRLKELNE